MKPKVVWRGPVKHIVWPSSNGAIKRANGKPSRFRIKPVSDKRAILNREYERAVKIWQRLRMKIDGFRCEFIYASGRRCNKKAHPRPHHVKFRGKNLCDIKFFKALCLPGHHEWPHRHPKQAVERGLLIREYAKH